MVLLQPEEDGRSGCLPILRHGFQQGIFPSLQICFNLPGIAWEHSGPASDNVDLRSDHECFCIILPGGLLFKAQTQSKDPKQPQSLPAERKSRSEAPLAGMAMSAAMSKGVVQDTELLLPPASTDLAEPPGKLCIFMEKAEL